MSADPPKRRETRAGDEATVEVQYRVRRDLTVALRGGGAEGSVPDQNDKPSTNQSAQRAAQA